MTSATRWSVAARTGEARSAKKAAIATRSENKLRASPSLSLSVQPLRMTQRPILLAKPIERAMLFPARRSFNAAPRTERPRRLGFPFGCPRRLRFTVRERREATFHSRLSRLGLPPRRARHGLRHDLRRDAWQSRPDPPQSAAGSQRLERPADRRARRSLE